MAGSEKVAVLEEWEAESRTNAHRYRLAIVGGEPRIEARGADCEDWSEIRSRRAEVKRRARRATGGGPRRARAPRPAPPPVAPEPPRPGDRVLLVVEVEVLTRLDSPTGPEYAVCLPRPLRPGDFASPETHRKVLELADRGDSV